MARHQLVSNLHQLTVREVQSAGDGDHADGGGLLLRVRGDSAAWVYRYTAPGGRRREMGLGVAHRGSTTQAGAALRAARDLAHEARELLRKGGDPIDARDAARLQARAADQSRRAVARREAMTLARAARAYHARVAEPALSAKHAAQWISSLENHLPPEIWHAPIDGIQAPALLAALEAIRPHARSRNHKTPDAIPETLRRIRQRLETIFEDAIFHGLCSANPAAALRRKLRERQGKQARGRLRALDYREAPAFMATLRAQAGTAARCLEFSVLTASRTNETILARWVEFDDENATWTIPGGRMKAGESHVVIIREHCREGAHVELRPDEANAEQVGVWLPCSRLGVLRSWKKIGEVPADVARGLRGLPSSENSPAWHGVVKTVYPPVNRDEAVVTVQVEA